APDRLRFDFVHQKPVSAEEIAAVEKLANEMVLDNSSVETRLMALEDAKASGAMALFGEKYGDTVRVASIGDGAFSLELCGGTHVRATGDIGLCLITEESGVAAGVRRIEAVTGLGALAEARGAIDELGEALAESRAKRGELAAWVRAQQAAVSRAQKEAQQLRTKLALGGGGGGAADEGQTKIGDATLVARQVDGVDKESLRALADTLKSRLSSGIVVLAAPLEEGKVAIVATVTPDLAKRAPAGQIVKHLAPIVGGGGGGRPDFAEAGGKDASQIPALLTEARALAERLLG
ncbi:MAG: DHHA1 domain-containing protein, partial [Vicinamibacteria bacterium]